MCNKSAESGLACHQKFSCGRGSTGRHMGLRQAETALVARKCPSGPPSFVLKMAEINMELEIRKMNPPWPSKWTDSNDMVTCPERPALALKQEMKRIVGFQVGKEAGSVVLAVKLCEGMTVEVCEGLNE